MNTDFILRVVWCPGLLYTFKVSQMEHNWHGGLMCTEGQGI